MNKTIRLLQAAFLAVLVLVPPASATDIYFGSSSAGSNNGTSCANAYAYNDGTHGWSLSAQQSAGNVLHICSGTWSLPSNVALFSTANAGTLGNPIKLIADQGATTIQCSDCSPNDGLNGAFQFTKSFWIFDGGNNLTIQNTLNGSSGSTCPGGSCSELTANSVLISSTASTCSGCATPGDNLIIRNFVQLGPVYVHGSGTTDTGFDSNSVISLSETYTKVSQNSFTGGYVMIGTQGLSSNQEIDHNTFTNCAHCYTIGMGGAAPTLSHVFIHDNWFHGTTIYDDQESACGGGSPGPCYHVNAKIIFANSGGGGNCGGGINCSITDLQIYNELCDGTWSTVGALNSCTFIDDQANSGVNGSTITYAIYNTVDNVGDGSNGLPGPSGAELVSQSQSAGSTNAYIMNNTVYQATIGGHIPSGTCFHMENPQSANISNNIMDSCGYHFVNNTANAMSGETINGNVWYDAGLGNTQGWIYAGGPPWNSSSTYGSNGVVNCLVANCATTPGPYYSLISSNTNHNPQSTNGTDWQSFGGCTGSGCAFNSWQGGLFDVNGAYGDPSISSSTFLIPNTSSNAYHIGSNLTSLCTGSPAGGFTAFTALCQGAPQTFGQGGSCGSGCLSRPSSGNWDAGAYPFSAAGPSGNSNYYIRSGGVSGGIQ